MSESQITQFVLVGAVFFAAGIVKGVLGMGLPTLAMGLLGLLMPVPQAAGLLTLPSFVTNLWQALSGTALRSLLARLWGMQAGIIAGAAFALLLPPQPDAFAKVLLGACLAVYGASGLAGWRPRPAEPRMQRLLAPAVGAITGLITAVTGVFVLPAVPYLQSLQLDRNELAQALGISFTTSTIALGFMLAVRGELGMAGVLQSAFAVAPALAGMFVGQKLREQMSEAAFRKCLFAGLLLLGAWLIFG